MKCKKAAQLRGFGEGGSNLPSRAFTLLAFLYALNMADPRKAGNTMWFTNKKTLSAEQATALNDQGWAAFRAQDLDAAQQCFENLAKACPDDPRWMNGVGAVSLARDDRANAHRHFQRAADRDYPGSHYNLGIMAYQDGDHDVARRHFQRAAEHDYPGSHYNLGSMAFQEGDHDTARQYFQKATEYDCVRSHFYLGSMAYQDGDHDAAVEHLNKAVRHDHPEALNLLGDVHLHAERYPQAEQAYRRAAELGNVDGYNNLGLLYLQLEDYQQAKQALLQALESDHVYAQHNLAVAYHRLGELEAAERWYLISFSEHGNLQSLENLGHVYSDSGREVEGQALVAASDKLYEDQPLNDYEQALIDRLLA